MITADQAERMRQRRRMGASYSEIADAEGVSKSTAYAHTKDIEPQGMSEAGPTTPEGEAAALVLRVEALERALHVLLELLGVGCGNCERGRFGALLGCSCCGTQLSVNWERNPKRNGLIESWLAGEPVVRLVKPPSIRKVRLWTRPQGEHS